MSYRTLKLITILLPPLIIGGFEYIRHEYLINYFSMESGNMIITLLTLMFSYIFSIWMFRIIEQKNRQLAEEQSRSAVYVERERIAQELHDNIAQILFFLNVNLKQGKIDEARSAISEIDNHLRQAIFNLRSLPEDGVSLSDRIRHWLDQWSVMTGIVVNQDIQLLDNFFSTGEEVDLFAVIQEAFTNIRKHSQAYQSIIILHASAEGWILKISDDGCGISNHDVNINKYGLSMMRKRAVKLGATMDIQNRDIGGTEICLSARREK